MRDAHRRILKRDHRLAARRETVLERDRCRRPTASCPGWRARSTADRPGPPRLASVLPGGLAVEVRRQPGHEHALAGARSRRSLACRAAGTATAADSIRLCAFDEIPPGDLVDLGARKAVEVRGSASRRRDRRSCCRTRRRRSSRRARCDRAATSRRRLRSHSDEWPIGSGDAAIVTSRAASGNTSPSTMSARQSTRPLAVRSRRPRNRAICARWCTPASAVSVASRSTSTGTF